MHWGTFPLADEGWDEPRKDLDMACKDAGVCRETEFVTLDHGEGIDAKEEEFDEEGLDVYDFVSDFDEEDLEEEEFEEEEEEMHHNN